MKYTRHSILPAISSTAALIVACALVTPFFALAQTTNIRLSDPLRELLFTPLEYGGEEDEATTTERTEQEGAAPATTTPAEAGENEELPPARGNPPAAPIDENRSAPPLPPSPQEAPAETAEAPAATEEDALNSLSTSPIDADGSGSFYGAFARPLALQNPYTPPPTLSLAHILALAAAALLAALAGYALLLPPRTAAHGFAPERERHIPRREAAALQAES
ncbi:hypothetical protein COU20_02825 [Candidatus Kaiserbacteria bacterium CG10_big_fil_rev_8_21_14_0_10_59_10]|uniref:Gram-positive cocci surface proteins LPxTG domain-containing protein n=1 Tax=Candidatus Kaiserbacteria bacterium CG10_big_fil_rev_8_21_14_0_10_59_10 TaxID=1974612 RepID=A0A2H0U7E7_9BACT|nr:MAG: hypothetical protein COU20_02825 [Candidatus Kaiserbacteria bacterium CG10_big_fil_rev_8_21_14_0_10_59_10]